MFSRIGWITSQNDTAPKLDPGEIAVMLSWITSQNDTAPKLPHITSELARVGLPVRTTLLQNKKVPEGRIPAVGLPVRTTLLQNPYNALQRPTTVGLPVRTTLLQNMYGFVAD